MNGFPRWLTEAARRYHGYYFAWAIVYTFWYHPMEATTGHLIDYVSVFVLAAIVGGILGLLRLLGRTARRANALSATEQDGVDFMRVHPAPGTPAATGEGRAHEYPRNIYTSQ